MASLPPVDLSAAGEDQPAYAAKSGRFHYMINAEDVVRQKLCREIVVVGRCRKMNQGADPGRGPL